MKDFVTEILSDDTVVIRNDNTTIGYARFNISARSLEYLFVNSNFRRLGIGTKLIEIAEKTAGSKLEPAMPLSDLGQKFLKAKIRTRHLDNNTT